MLWDRSQSKCYSGTNPLLQGTGPMLLGPGLGSMFHLLVRFSTVKPKSAYLKKSIYFFNRLGPSGTFGMHLCDNTF